MVKTLVFLLGIVLISSCTLSTQQEMNLNKDIRQFIEVRNEGDELSFLNYTHPIIVRHYKDLDDSIFKEKFKLISQENNPNLSQSNIVYWDQSYIKGVAKNDSLIEARLEISLIKNTKSLDSTTTFYAISTNNTSNWLFVSGYDYFHVLGKEYRLFQ